VATDFFGGDDSIKALVLQPDGKIVAAGGTTIGFDFIFAAARYTASGALDPTFGSGGKVTISDMGGASCIALQHDGKLVAGDTFTTLVRLNGDGSLDSTFGSGGKVAVGGPQFMLYDVAMQSDGRIVAAGADVIIIAPDPEGGFLGRQLFAVARFNANGSVDSTFGEGGRVRTDAGRP